MRPRLRLSSMMKMMPKRISSFVHRLHNEKSFVATKDIDLTFKCARFQADPFAGMKSKKQIVSRGATNMQASA